LAEAARVEKARSGSWRVRVNAPRDSALEPSRQRQLHGMHCAEAHTQTRSGNSIAAGAAIRSLNQSDQSIFSRPAVMVQLASPRGRERGRISHKAHWSASRRSGGGGEKALCRVVWYPLGSARLGEGRAPTVLLAKSEWSRSHGHENRIAPALELLPGLLADRIRPASRVGDRRDEDRMAKAPNEGVRIPNDRRVWAGRLTGSRWRLMRGTRKKREICCGAFRGGVRDVRARFPGGPFGFRPDAGRSRRW